MKKTLLSTFIIQCFWIVAYPQTRYHQYTAQFENPGHPAVPVSAGYVGGAGDEYLSAAVVLPNGTVIMGGNGFGPDFKLPGVETVVVGEDGPPPNFIMPLYTEGKKAGKRKIPDWRHTQGAGFILELNKAYDGIKKAVRFPWGSGSLTDLAADADGRLYVAGLCGDGFDNLTRANFLDPVGMSGDRPIFIGRLREDLSGFIWCRVLDDYHEWAPRLDVTEKNRINLTGRNTYLFDSSGKLLQATPVAEAPIPLRGINPATYTLSVRGVDPETHASAHAGGRSVRTGWESWRQPLLEVYDNQGDLRHEFYRWSPEAVGSNWCRLVSNTDIRGVTYDGDGNLLLIGWSAGTSSVLEQLPYDLGRSVDAQLGYKTGLGLTTDRAVAASFSHLIRMNSETGEVMAKTLLFGYVGSKDVPNSVQTELLESAADDSLLVAGSSAYGFIETSGLKLNSLSPDEDYLGGPFFMLLSKDMTDIRFSSLLPGAGRVPLASKGPKKSVPYKTASAQVGDQVISVLVCGAEYHERFMSKQPVQPQFGGGELDGMYVILRMNPDSTFRKPETVKQAKVVDGNVKGKSVTSPGIYNVPEGIPRNDSLLILSDPTGKFWPAYYVGHPVGVGTVDTSGTGGFTLSGRPQDVQLSEGADQSRRLGGPLAKRATVQSEGGQEWKERMFPEFGLQVTLTGTATCRGIITLNGKKVETEGDLEMRDAVYPAKGIVLHGFLHTTMGALGLEEVHSVPEEYPVKIEFFAPGFRKRKL